MGAPIPRGDDALTVVCFRTVDGPSLAPGSTEIPCGACGEPCWISPATRATAERNAPFLVRCVHCTMAVPQ